MNYIIWSNLNIDPNNWDLERDYSEEEKYIAICDILAQYLEDERAELSISVPDGILIIADLDLWNGRDHAYKRLPRGCKISDCLYADSGCAYLEWFVDGEGEFRSKQIHPDGTNYLRFRKIRNGVEEEEIALLEEHIVNGTVTEAEIDQITEKLGPDIAQIYGWEGIS